MQSTLVISKSSTHAKIDHIKDRGSGTAAHHKIFWFDIPAKKSFTMQKLNSFELCETLFTIWMARTIEVSRLNFPPQSFMSS